MLTMLGRKQLKPPMQDDLEKLCDIFQGLEELHQIIGAKVRETKLDFILQQRFISHLENMRKELDSAKLLCIRSRLRAICTG